MTKDILKFVALMDAGKIEEAMQLCEEFEWHTVTDEQIRDGLAIGEAILAYEALDESSSKPSD